MAPSSPDESRYNRFYYKPRLQLFIRGVVKTLVCVAVIALSVIAQKSCKCRDSWLCAGPSVDVFLLICVRSHCAWSLVPKVDVTDCSRAAKVGYHLLFSSYRLWRMLFRPELDPMTRSRDFFSGCHAMPAPICYCEAGLNSAGATFWLVVSGWQDARVCLPTAVPECLAVLFAIQA